MKKICLLLLFVILTVSILTACNIANIDEDINNNSKNSERQSYTYELKAELNYKANILNCSEKITFYNNFNFDIDRVNFDLNTRAFEKDAKYKAVDFNDIERVYPNGLDFSETDIQSVKVNGETVNFEICGSDKNILSVILREKMPPDFGCEITMDFTVKIPNVMHRFGYVNGCYNLSCFYPVVSEDDGEKFYENIYYNYGDPFDNSYSILKAEIILPADYLAAFGGELVSERKDGVKKILKIYSDKIKNFAICVSNQYRKISSKYDDVEINYFYLFDKLPERTLRNALKSYELFCNTFNKLDQKKYDIAETYFCDGGMEFTGLSMLSAALTDGERERVVVHETAHQWWYNSVASSQIEAPWIDEGLAEFSTYYYLTRIDYDKAERFKKEALSEYRDSKFSSTIIEKPLSEYKNKEEYYIVCYRKGFALFEELYSIDKDEFMKFIKNIAEKFKYKKLNADTLIELLSQKNSWGKILENYLN